MADTLPRITMPKTSGPASRAQPLLGAVVPMRNPGNDEGYPAKVHIRAALEEHPGSLKSLLISTPIDPPRARPGVSFKPGQRGGYPRPTRSRVRSVGVSTRSDTPST